MNTEEEELLQVEKAWDAAMISNDAYEIEKFMADDWVIVGTEGGITTKADFIATIRSGEVQHSRMDADSTEIKVYGNSALIISRGTSAGTFNGEHFEFYEWATSVFIRQNNSWLCVLTMVTPADTP